MNCLYGGLYTQYLSLPQDGATWNYGIANFLLGRGGDDHTDVAVLGYMPSAAAGLELFDSLVRTSAAAPPIKGQAVSVFGGANFMLDYFSISGDGFDGSGNMYILSLSAGAIASIYSGSYVFLPYAFISLPLFGSVSVEIDGDSYDEDIESGKPGVSIGFDVRFMQGQDRFISAGTMLQQMSEAVEGGDDVRTIMLNVSWNY